MPGKVTRDCCEWENVLFEIPSMDDGSMRRLMQDGADCMLGILSSTYAF